MAGFHVFDDGLQGAALVIFIVFTPLCMLATALRFVSSRISFGRQGIEDWLALGALVFFLIWVALSCFALSILNGRDTAQMQLDEITDAFRLIWVASLFFAPNQLCAKLSILCLYHRIFGINRSYRPWIFGLGIFQILWSIETPLVEAFECTPVYKYWDLTYVGGSCINIGPYLAANETLNSLADFMLALFAIMVLRKLQTSTSTKWQLAALFAVGGFAGVIGFVKIGFAFTVNVHNQIQMGLWATLQMAFSIICCCAITYGPLFKRPSGETRTGYSMGGYEHSWPGRSGYSGENTFVDGHDDLEARDKNHQFTTEISTQSARHSAGSGEQALLGGTDANRVLMKSVVDQTYEPSISHHKRLSELQ
ncbi:putative Hybrid PKS-NRPS biosynthetic cluster [Pestalotiopsis sp. IQ-011]